LKGLAEEDFKVTGRLGLTKFKNVQGIIAVLVTMNMASCAGDIQPSGSQPLLSTSNELRITNYSPANEEVNVALDARVTLTFNQEIEPYFPAHRQNFEVWTTDGVRLPGNVTVNRDLIDDPNGSGAKVSQMTLRPPSRYWMPNREYIVLWREAPPKGSTENAILAGVEARFGNPPDRLASGSVRFTTGQEFRNLPRPDVEVLAQTPGHQLQSTPSGGGSLLDGIDGYLSITDNPQVMFMLSEPVRHGSFDTTTGLLPEIGYGMPGGRMPICTTSINHSCFAGVTIGLIDSNFPISDFMSQATTAVSNPSAWMSFMRDQYSRLPGYVRTTNGRRILIFELANGTRFPDTIAQAIIVVLNGFNSTDSYPGVPPRGLRNGIYVGGFLHYSGFQLPSGFPDIRTFLRNNGVGR